MKIPILREVPMKTLVLLVSLLFCLNGFATEEPADKGAESEGPQVAVAEKDPAECGQLLADLGPAASAGELVSVPSGPPTRPMAESLPENVIAIKGLAKDLSSKMLASGLIHSDFFTQAIIRNIPSTVDENGAALYVSGLNSVQMNALANKIYEDMMAAAENASSGLSTKGLVDPVTASGIIQRTQAQKVIDKIGEALVLVATNGELINFFEALETKVLAQSRTGKIKLIGFSTVTLIAAIGGVIQTGDISYLQLVGWFGVAGGSGIAALRNRPNAVVGRTQRKALNDLEDQTASLKNALRGYNFFQNPDKKRITAQLDQIENYLKNELSDARELETEDYEIGRATGQLRREMSRLYHVEFAKWVSATQFKTIQILQNFQTIFESDQRDQEFQVFENILAEALEVTNRLMQLNDQLVLSLKEDIEKLEAISPDPMQKGSYDQMVVDLKKRKLGQEQFKGTMMMVKESFRTTMLAARQVREADMNLLTAQILQALRGGGGFEEMDQSNPLVVLLQSVEGLNSSLMGLGLTPDQAVVGMSVTEENLEDSIKECRAMARGAASGAATNQILFDCFEKLKHLMNASDCRSMALETTTGSAMNQLLSKCVNELNPQYSEMDVKMCKKTATSAATGKAQNSMLFDCFHIFKRSMSLAECRGLAKSMTTGSNQDELMAMCVEGS